jgi:hypothetical protein
MHQCVPGVRNGKTGMDPRTLKVAGLVEISSAVFIDPAAFNI